MKRPFYLLLLLFFVFIVSGCNKDNDGNNSSQIPNIPTDIAININLPSYNALSNVGGFAYAQGGSRGVVVYRVGLDQFAAFDRHCTYQVSEGCTIEVDDGNLATDQECCESVFEIINGTPVEGPAERPLYQYNTQFNPNANTVRIFN